MGGLRKVMLLIVLLALIPNAKAEINYFFQVQDNGETNTTIEITAPIQFKIPPDANPSIEGGTLEKEENTICAKTEEIAIITYATSYYTRKEKGVWHFEAETPSSTSIELTLPQQVHVVQSQPNANFEKEENWKLTWQNTTNSITVSYVSVNQASFTQEKPIRTQNKNLIITILLLVAIGIYLVISKRKVPFLKPKITDGQLNIMRAANPNEALVMQILLKYNGRIKRNTLEKETKLSKSSLASTLKNLEKKNIINIDRTFFVHYITLTDWFKSL